LGRRRGRVPTLFGSETPVTGASRSAQKLRRWGAERGLPVYREKTRISVGERFVVFRARRTDRLTVVLKCVRPDRRAPTHDELRRHELDVLQRFDSDAVTRPLGFEETDEGLTLILLDAGPESLLERLERGPFEVASFLDLAIAMATCLAEVHRRGVIHRDI